jgi:hypothetical protein
MQASRRDVAAQLRVMIGISSGLSDSLVKGAGVQGRAVTIGGTLVGVTCGLSRAAAPPLPLAVLPL